MKILFFGPNGSGKGTQGAMVKEKFGIPHIETGVIFRENISGGTELGKQAKGYIDRGELVPDSITIPMILDRLKADDCRTGWLLDGFPRNLTQAQELDKALEKEGIRLDIVIEMVLDRQIAKKRIMGRRLCVNDNNHPNNIYIDAIKPNGDQVPGVRRQPQDPLRRPGRGGHRPAPQHLLRRQDRHHGRHPVLQGPLGQAEGAAQDRGTRRPPGRQGSRGRAHGQARRVSSPPTPLHSAESRDAV